MRKIFVLCVQGFKIFTNSKKTTTGIFVIALFFLPGSLTQAQNRVTAITLPTTQTGSVTYGNPSGATYAVTLTTNGGPGDGSSNITLNWTGATPSGVSY